MIGARLRSAARDRLAEIEWRAHMDELDRRERAAAADPDEALRQIREATDYAGIELNEDALRECGAPELTWLARRVTEIVGELATGDPERDAELLPGRLAAFVRGLAVEEPSAPRIAHRARLRAALKRDEQAAHDDPAEYLRQLDEIILWATEGLSDGECDALNLGANDLRGVADYAARIARLIVAGVSREDADRLAARADAVHIVELAEWGCPPELLRLILD